MPNSPDLTEEVKVGQLPLTNGNGQRVQVKALSTREYVSGSAYHWYANMPRALPWSFDDLTESFGQDLYERMMFDAQVKAMVSVLKSSVLEEGVSLAPAIEDKEDADYDQAVEMFESAEKMLSDLTQSLDDTLWDLLDAFALGNRMAEQVYDLDATPSGKQQYMLKTLSVKPRESVAFVVDAFMNVLGILGRVPGQPFGVQQGVLLTSIKDATNLLPRSKFAVLSFRPKNGDPRGISCLRAAFDPWNQKQQLKREFLKYLTQFASPSLVGFTAEGAEPYALANPDGSPMLDEFGNPVMRTPEEDMVAALQAFANGTATAFPYGASVKPIEMSGDGKPFLDAFAFLDRQITKAILVQTLATEEGIHQSRASSGVHKDLLDTIVRQMKRPVERMIERDILHVWVRLNYGDDLVRLSPKATLGVAEQEDLPRLWVATAALMNAGYLDQSQLPGMDKTIGTPERELPAEGDDLATGQGAVPPPQNQPAPPQQQQGTNQTGQGDDAGGNTQPDGIGRPAQFGKSKKPPKPDEEIRRAEDALKQELDSLFSDVWRGKG